jgi:hypothetical protein
MDVKLARIRTVIQLHTHHKLERTRLASGIDAMEREEAPSIAMDVEISMGTLENNQGAFGKIKCDPKPHSCVTNPDKLGNPERVAVALLVAT